MNRSIAIAAATSLVAVPAFAATIDGVLDAVYGPPKAVQQVGTQFGNNTNPAPDVANGSELNAAYGYVAGGNLYLFFSGNLETNFNKLNVFIDGIAGGGQNKLRGDNPDIDFNGLNRMGDDGSGNGLTFDTGFSPDYFISVTSGNSPTETYLNAAQLLTLGGGSGGFLGGGVGTVVNGSNGIIVAVNNSNILGVGPFGDPFDSDPATVTTGIELLVPLSVLGPIDGDNLRVAAMINGGGYDFLSNQVLGALPSGTPNLGDPRNVNFNQFEGQQFFTVVIPEPASLSAMALFGLILRRRRV